MSAYRMNHASVRNHQFLQFQDMHCCIDQKGQLFGEAS